MFTLLLALCLHPVQEQTDSAEQLRRAAFRGDLAAVQKLIASGVKVDAPDDYGRTALGIAASRGHAELAAALLDAGADIEKADRFYRFTPLTMAVIAKQPKTIRLLIQRKAKGAGDALMFVVTDDQPEVLKALLTDGTITQSQLRSALSAAKGGGAKANVALLAPRIEKRPDGDDEPKTSDPETPAAPARTAAQLKPFAGKYAGPGETEMEIKAGENRLDVTVAGQDLALVPSGETEFRLGDAVVVTFQLSDGVAESLTWAAGGGSVEFKRAKPEPDTPAESKPAEPVKWADYSFDSANWPAFRGVLSRGIIERQDLPTKWNVETGENIAWKTQVSGLGLSCPVVWGDSVFVSTAVPVDTQASDESQLKTGLYGDVDSVEDDREYEFRLLCLSLSTGDVLWSRKCRSAKPQVKRHTKSSHANPTPATDGRYVVASFGSEGVYCFRTDGELVWKKDYGLLDSGWFFDRTFQWGFGSSPYIFENTVYLQCDIQDQSFLVALDVESGVQRWRVNRNDIPTWSSPVAYRDPAGAARVAVNGTREAAMYNAADGSRLWHLGGMSEIVVPTPQVTPSYVLLASGYAPVRPILAIRHSASGGFHADGSSAEEQSADQPEAKDAAAVDKAGQAQSEGKGPVSGPFAWRLRNGGSYLPTPLIYRGYVHVVSNSGVLTCYNANTGERLSRVRLRGAKSCTGSPVAADGMLYITAENGRTFVVPAGPDQKPVSTNEIGEAVLSTPAIAGGRLLIRAENHLFAIGSMQKPK